MKKVNPRFDYDVDVGFLFTKKMKYSKARSLRKKYFVFSLVLFILGCILAGLGLDYNITIYWIGMLLILSGFVSLHHSIIIHAAISWKPSPEEVEKILREKWRFCTLGGHISANYIPTSRVIDSVRRPCVNLRWMLSVADRRRETQEQNLLS